MKKIFGLIAIIGLISIVGCREKGWTEVKVTKLAQMPYVVTDKNETIKADTAFWYHLKAKTYNLPVEAWVSPLGTAIGASKILSTSKN